MMASIRDVAALLLMRRCYNIYPRNAAVRRSAVAGPSMRINTAATNAIVKQRLFA
jgi:hypothetical protein